MLNDFFLEKLDPCDRQHYLCILHGVKLGLSRFSMPSVAIPRISAIMRALYSDHPEIFWLHPEAFEVETSGYRTDVIVNSFLAASDIRQIKAKYRSIAAIILRNKNARSEYGRLIAIHQYMITHVGYDNGDSCAATASAAGPILQGSAKCSGIARMTKMLCDLCDVPCIIIHGTSNGNGCVEEHAWNLVQINGKWIHIDITWDITIGGGEKRYDYFGLTDSEISLTHSWNKALIPECNSPELNFHYQVGHVYSNLKAAMVSIANSFNNGKQSAIGKITNICTEHEFLRYFDYALSRIISLENVQYSIHFNQMIGVYRIQILQ